MGLIQYFSTSVQRLFGKPVARSDDELFSKKQWESFTFGEATPVMHGRDLLDYLQTWSNGTYYEPPISFKGLAKSFRSSPFHSSAIYVKRNVLVSTLKKGTLLTSTQLEKTDLDARVFGNAYLRRKESRTGKLIGFEVLPALHMRKMIKGDDRYCYIGKNGKILEYGEGEIFHYVEPDINQEIYGLPEYLSALQAAWLNESATLFRRRYYDNGSHAGFILYMTDAAHKEDDINNLRKALKESKGPGNFRNLLMYAPNGKKDGLQIIPIAEVGAKDEFFNIKNVSANDIAVGHRVPLQMLAVKPENTGGLGAMDTASEVFVRNEIVPIQRRWSALNDWASQTVVEFDDYKIAPPQ